jgi:hypothetical protein
VVHIDFNIPVALATLANPLNGLHLNQFVQLELKNPIGATVKASPASPHAHTPTRAHPSTHPPINTHPLTHMHTRTHPHTSAERAPPLPFVPVLRTNPVGTAV